MRRLVFLDELLKRPVLRASEMSPNQLATVASHRPPLSRRAALHTLAAEFHQPVTRTAWARYVDPVSVVETGRLHQLLRDALILYRRRSTDTMKPDNWRELAQWVSQWVQTEEAAMEAERRDGRTERWSGKEYLYGEWLGKLSEEQMQMTASAFEELANSARIHPAVKKEIFGHICAIISKV